MILAGIPSGENWRVIEPNQVCWGLQGPSYPGHQGLINGLKMIVFVTSIAVPKFNCNTRELLNPAKCARAKSAKKDLCLG